MIYIITTILKQSHAPHKKKKIENGAGVCEFDMTDFS